MKKTLLSLLLIFIANIAFAQSAQDCQTLTCVRSNIDSIDEKIVTLIAERLSYVKRAGELKKVAHKPIHDQAREDQILIMVTEQLKKAGYPDNIAREIFKTILVQSNIYEKQ